MSHNSTQLHYLDIDGDGDVDFDDVRSSVSKTLNSFMDFALRDNVLEVAVGLIFASSFTAMANSLVSDMILPLFSLLPFLSRNLEAKFAILRAGESGSRDYNTIEQALADGAVVWAYGLFLDKVFRFFLIALALWAIASLYGRITSDNIIKKQVRCKYCRKYISEKAKRCPLCTSWSDGREEKEHLERTQTDPLI